MISVGILSSSTIRFVLNGEFCFNGQQFVGEHYVSYSDGKIHFLDQEFSEIIFSPSVSKSNFSLKDVVIGVGFHWERKETQTFGGSLRFIVENNTLTAINDLPIEDYLISVISSEMSATSSPELLKAHAVTSRSWLYAQLIARRRCLNNQQFHAFDTETEHIKWYDKDDHINFDVCADDHCQRYQGITRASTLAVKEAVRSTAHLVLFDENGEVCDARFSKCCGGITELFENCWEPQSHSYLKSFSDDKKHESKNLPMTETQARNFILSEQETDFCNTKDARILREVLNSYDQETPDFYRWTIRYSQSELSSLIQNRSGIDFGKILDLVPILRGPSGRIVKLKIVGEKRSLIIGKELEIRKWLSSSHLYSSAFVVERENSDFILKGAGWGHGVGLCQIGAAVMADKGYDYQQILAHYFPQTILKSVKER